MGKEARVVKHRHCKWCKQDLRTSAKKIVEHAIFCKRLKDVGLILPESERQLVEV